MGYIHKYKRKNDGGTLANITSGGDGSSGLGYLKNKIISAYDLNGKYVRTFSSVIEAAKHFKTSHGHIIGCAKGRSNYCKRLQWRYGENKNNIASVVWTNKIKHDSIGQFNKN